VTPKTAEKLREQHAAGLKADILLRATQELYGQREEQTLRELIAWFRSEPWDERTAIKYIAVLNENRAQREELEHRARKGTEARARLMGGGSTADD
jgi:hypothetical protein